MSLSVNSKKQKNSQELVPAKFLKPSRNPEKNINVKIPVEIMILAMSFLSARDLATASCVCKLWNERASSKYLWQPLCAREGFSLSQSEDKKSKKKSYSAKQIYHTGMLNRMNTIKGQLDKDLALLSRKHLISKKLEKKFHELFKKLIRRPLDGDIKRSQTCDLIKKWSSETHYASEKSLNYKLSDEEMLVISACGVYDLNTLQHIMQQEKITTLPSDGKARKNIVRMACDSKDSEMLRFILNLVKDSQDFPELLSKGLQHCITQGLEADAIQLFIDYGAVVYLHYLHESLIVACKRQENGMTVPQLLCDHLTFETSEVFHNSHTKDSFTREICLKAFEIQDLELIKKLESIEIFKNAPVFRELINKLLPLKIRTAPNMHSLQGIHNDTWYGDEPVLSKLSVIQYFLDKDKIKIEYVSDLFKAALKRGHKEYFDFLLEEHIFNPDQNSGKYAIQGKNPELVQKLLDNGYSFSVSDLIEHLKDDKQGDKIFSLIKKHNKKIFLDASFREIINSFDNGYPMNARVSEKNTYENLIKICVYILSLNPTIENINYLNTQIKKESSLIKNQLKDLKPQKGTLYKRNTRKLEFLKQLKAKFEEAASTRKKPTKEPKKKDKEPLDKSQQAAYEAGLKDLIQRYMDMGIYPQKDTEEVKQLILKEYKDKEHEITSWGKTKVLGKKTPKIVNKPKLTKKAKNKYKYGTTKKGKEKKDSSSSSSSESGSSSSSSSDEVRLKRRRHKKK